MSTVDTLMTAVAAIAVNDVYKPYLRPRATDRQLLRVARITSVAVAVLGVTLVPAFMNFASIYDAHGAFTAAVTPPLVVTLMLSVLWRRFTATAALWTLVGGLAAIGLSLFVPEVIQPFAHGVPMKEVEDGFLSGMKQYKFMRAAYGIVICLAIAIPIALLTRPEPVERQRGLVWGTVADAIRRYKGGEGREQETTRARAFPRRMETEPAFSGEAMLSVVNMSPALAKALGASPGDLVYLSDTRWWLGGLRSVQAKVGEIDSALEGEVVVLGPKSYRQVITPQRTEMPVLVARWC